MTNLDIVVAHYNSKSFEKAIHVFQNELEKRNTNIRNIIIYNKSAVVPSPSFNEIKTYTIKNTENIGREGETYLKHIIENYDNLSDYTLFIQDDTHNHITPYIRFFYLIHKQISQKINYYIYPSMYRVGGTCLPQTIVNGHSKLPFFKNPFLIKESCERLGIFLPETYTTNICAFLLVSKESIHKHDVEFYKKVREWLLEDDTHGYCLEYMWEIIFR